MQGDYWPLAGPARALGGRTTARARVRAGTIIVWSFFVFVLGRSVILVKLVQNRPSISTVVAIFHPLVHSCYGQYGRQFIHSF